VQRTDLARLQQRIATTEAARRKAEDRATECERLLARATRTLRRSARVLESRPPQ
jgi:hypothetical protein